MENKNNSKFFYKFKNQNKESTLKQAEIEGIWGKDYKNKTLIFFSHKVEYKKQVSQIKNSLKEENVSCFIAHQDISPALEWKEEIIKALETMDIFVGIITKNFHSGSWTDQEIGYAYKRGVPRLFIRIGESTLKKVKRLFWFF